MKSIILSFFLFTLITDLSAQENPFEIKITFKPFKNQYIYLGYYYGKQKPIIDSVLLDDNSYGVFKGNRKLEGGLYLIGYPDKSNYFEVFIDKQQQFSITADSADILNSIRFENSEDNVLFNAYQQFTAKKGNAIEKAKKQLAEAKNAKDSAAFTAIINKENEAIHQYRLDFVKAHPKATLTVLLNAMKEPAIPPADQQPGGKYDSTYAYQYYKKHYWDDVYFFDERLVRTPVFEPKLDKYFDQVVYPNPDSVIRELDWMLGYASASPEMEKFLLVKFVNRYLNQKYMWEDKVFVHLFEKYFSQKDYSWMTEKGKKTVFDRAYSLMANLLGNPASDIELPDSNGKTQTLYGMSSPFTVVCFWDPTCGHCKETLPRIDSIYRAKWKNENVKIFAVAKESEAGKPEWKKFIAGHHLEGWTHVYYSKEEESERVKSGIPGYSQLYDITTVPTLYLLDSEKRIIAKKIPFEQIDEVLEFKIKGQ
ncbi:MAG: DUF5106 domain-containing protein [Terrimonas sp.]|nr:DUF5106 domain-containing protein [Terrimonas sp.]